jgi:hypothetical protein
MQGRPERDSQDRGDRGTWIAHHVDEDRIREERAQEPDPSRVPGVLVDEAMPTHGSLMGLDDPCKA